MPCRAGRERARRVLLVSSSRAVNRAGNRGPLLAFCFVLTFFVVPFRNFRAFLAVRLIAARCVCTPRCARHDSHSLSFSARPLSSREWYQQRFSRFSICSCAIHNSVRLKFGYFLCTSIIYILIRHIHVYIAMHCHFHASNILQ